MRNSLSVHLLRLRFLARQGYPLSCCGREELPLVIAPIGALTMHTFPVFIKKAGNSPIMPVLPRFFLAVPGDRA
jgi:hypothetical protein